MTFENYFGFMANTLAILPGGMVGVIGCLAGELLGIQRRLNAWEKRWMAT